MKIKQYIESGILETYVLGMASEEEINELLDLKAKHVRIREALYNLEIELENTAQCMGVQPSSGRWLKVQRNLYDVIEKPAPKELKLIVFPKRTKQDLELAQEQQLLEIDANHIRVVKTYKLVLCAALVLILLLIVFSRNYYLKNGREKEEIERLKTELKLIKPR